MKYDYIEREQSNLEWFVPRTIDSWEYKGTTLFYGESGSGIRRFYNPIAEKPLLFLEFLELPPVPQKIAKFIEQYGPLTALEVPADDDSLEIDTVDYCNGAPIKTVIERDVVDVYVDVIEPLTEEVLYALMKRARRNKISPINTNEEIFLGPQLIFLESLAFWQKQIWNMQKVYLAWEIVRSKDYTLLKKILCPLPEDEHQPGNALFLFSNLPRETILSFQNAADLWQALKSHSEELCSVLPPGVPLFFSELPLFVNYGDTSSCLRTLTQWLVAEINRYARFSRPYVVLQEEKLKAFLRPKNLLAAMWLQFFYWVTGEKEFKRCAVCGLWEDITNKRMGWKMHPECAQRERFRRHYEKIKKARELYQEGHTPAEISALLGKSQQWVEERLKKMEREKHDPPGTP
jgi:hypothetical protein